LFIDQGVTGETPFWNLRDVLMILLKEDCVVQLVQPIMQVKLEQEGLRLQMMTVLNSHKVWLNKEIYKEMQGVEGVIEALQLPVTDVKFIFSERQDLSEFIQRY
jgi:hypothetical protein